MLLRTEKEDDKEGLRASDGDGPKGESGNKRARLGSLSLSLKTNIFLLLIFELRRRKGGFHKGLKADLKQVKFGEKYIFI
jgi:hypothetical protein